MGRTGRRGRTPWLRRRLPSGRSVDGAVSGPPLWVVPSSPTNTRSESRALGHSVRSWAVFREGIQHVRSRDVSAERQHGAIPHRCRRGARHATEVRMHDGGRSVGVVEDAPYLATGERRIQRDGLEPALVRGELPDDDVNVVGQRVGEDVRPSACHGHATRAPPDGLAPPAGEGQGLTRRRGHDGGLIWEFPWTVQNPSGRSHGSFHGE